MALSGGPTTQAAKRNESEAVCTFCCVGGASEKSTVHKGTPGNTIDYMRKRSALVQTIQTILTGTQFRRLWMYHAEGRSQEEIAVIEGSTQQRISKSLRLAKKKIKNFLSD